MFLKSKQFVRSPRSHDIKPLRHIRSCPPTVCIVQPCLSQPNLDRELILVTPRRVFATCCRVVRYPIVRPALCSLFVAQHRVARVMSDTVIHYSALSSHRVTVLWCSLHPMVIDRPSLSLAAHCSNSERSYKSPCPWAGPQSCTLAPYERAG